MIALPVLPVLTEYFGPSTQARWLLAGAANDYDNGRVDAAQTALLQAYDLSPDILLDPNFLEQFERIELDPDNPPKSSRIWAEMIRRFAEAPQKAAAAMEISNLLSKRQQFAQAADLLSEFLPPLPERTAVQNNQLAYMRSLAGTDLELAMQEVDAALRQEKNESFLDTKAWVLHAMGRNEEALPFAEESLSMLLGKWRANSVLEPLIAQMEEIEQGLEKMPAPPSVSAEEQISAGSESEQGSTEAPTAEAKKKRTRGWAHFQLMEEFPAVARGLPEITEMIATLRYHRMKIHAALEDTESAARDARWLEAFCDKDPETLH